MEDPEPIPCTKYRLVSDGYYNYIQYAVERKFLWWKWTTWGNVPNYNIAEVIDSKGLHRQLLYLNSRHTSDLEEFPNKYPHIDDYFAVLKEKRDAFFAKNNSDAEVAELKKQWVKYLN